MMSRYLIVGCVATALALFAWQTISNVALPWHDATLRQFADSTAATAAIQAQAGENGVYVADKGVFLATSFRPDGANRSTQMLPMMASMLLLDLGVALVLAFAVLRLPVGRSVDAGITLALAALGIAMIKHFSEAIWYGFPIAYSIVNVVDLTVNGLIAGLVLGALRNRYAPAAVAVDSAPGVRAGGGIPAVGAREPVRSA
jgi:hypothetical protein